VTISPQHYMLLGQYSNMLLAQQHAAALGLPQFPFNPLLDHQLRAPASHGIDLNLLNTASFGFGPAEAARAAGPARLSQPARASPISQWGALAHQLAARSAPSSAPRLDLHSDGPGHSSSAPSRAAAATYGPPHAHAGIDSDLAAASQPQRRARTRVVYRSVIDCGIVKDGERQRMMFSDFFGRDVEVFTVRGHMLPRTASVHLITHEYA
jgi:hypothetical protein